MTDKAQHGGKREGAGRPKTGNVGKRMTIHVDKDNLVFAHVLSKQRWLSKYINNWMRIANNREPKDYDL